MLTGHGGKHRHELPDEAIVLQGIADAAKWILGQMTRKGHPVEDLASVPMAKRLMAEHFVVCNGVVRMRYTQTHPMTMT